MGDLGRPRRLEGFTKGGPIFPQQTTAACRLFAVTERFKTCAADGVGCGLVAGDGFEPLTFWLGGFWKDR